MDMYLYVYVCIIYNMYMYAYECTYMYMHAYVRMYNKYVFVGTHGHGVWVVSCFAISLRSISPVLSVLRV